MMRFRDISLQGEDCQDRSGIPPVRSRRWGRSAEGCHTNPNQSLFRENALPHAVKSWRHSLRNDVWRMPMRAIIEAFRTSGRSFFRDKGCRTLCDKAFWKVVRIRTTRPGFRCPTAGFSARSDARVTAPIFGTNYPDAIASPDVHPRDHGRRGSGRSRRAPRRIPRSSPRN